MDTDIRKKHESLLKDKALARSLQVLDFEFIKLDMRGSLSDLAKDSRSALTSFARDGSGGIFFIKNDDLSVVFIDSEGNAGYFANSFDEAISIICSFPFSWHDMISAGYSKELLRQTQEERAKEIEEDIAGTSDLNEYYQSIGYDPASHYEEGRKLAAHIAEKLALSPDGDPICIFFNGLNRKPRFSVISNEGVEFEQLIVEA